MTKLPNILHLSDQEMAEVADAAATLEVGKRDSFLMRFAAHHRHCDGDIKRAISKPMQGLTQDFTLHRRGN